MSFSQDVKNEILHRKIVRSCCVTAAAYAVACFGKYFDDRGVVLQTENEGIAQLAQKLYARCGITGTVISKERGTGLIYEFSVKDPEQVQKMLNLFGHTGCETTLRIRPDCFKCQKCGSFFISTAFLCCGTATDPEKEYNIEFLSPRHSLSQQLEGILAQYEFNPHRAVRKGANTVYVKSSDHLEDLLTFMGAGNAAMRIMEQRMYNDMRNKTNRLSNCETANMGKTVQAAVQVRLAIEMLEETGALETLPKPLQQAARLLHTKQVKHAGWVGAQVFAVLVPHDLAYYGIAVQVYKTHFVHLFILRFPRNCRAKIIHGFVVEFPPMLGIVMPACRAAKEPLVMAYYFVYPDGGVLAYKVSAKLHGVAP